MGSVDQSDVKSHVMNLTTKRVQFWRKKQLFYLIEVAISQPHGNYNLDSSRTKQEPFSEFHNKFLEELNDMSPNLRTYKKSALSVHKKRERMQQPEEKSDEKRSHKKKKIIDQRGRPREYGNATTAGLNCYGRDNLAKFLRFFPDKTSIYEKRP